MKKRNDINEEFKWNLSSLYKNLEEFEEDFEDIKKQGDVLGVTFDTMPVLETDR